MTVTEACADSILSKQPRARNPKQLLNPLLIRSADGPWVDVRGLVHREGDGYGFGFEGSVFGESGIQVQLRKPEHTQNTIIRTDWRTLN